MVFKTRLSIPCKISPEIKLVVLYKKGFFSCDDWITFYIQLRTDLNIAVPYGTYEHVPSAPLPHITAPQFREPVFPGKKYASQVMVLAHGCVGFKK